MPKNRIKTQFKTDSEIARFHRSEGVMRCHDDKDNFVVCYQDARYYWYVLETSPHVRYRLTRVTKFPPKEREEMLVNVRVETHTSEHITLAQSQGGLVELRIEGPRGGLIDAITVDPGMLIYSLRKFLPRQHQEVEF